MTELADTPQPQPPDLMETDSGTEDIRPNLKRRRSRRRRWYLRAVIPVTPVILLTLLVISIGSMHGCTLVGMDPELDSGVSFRLGPVANAAMPVHVRACVPSHCVSDPVKNWSVGRGFGSDSYLEGSWVVWVKDP